MKLCGPHGLYGEGFQNSQKNCGCGYVPLAGSQMFTCLITVVTTLSHSSYQSYGYPEDILQILT